MKITALIENVPFNDEFCSEHGLSLYIETSDRKILFDMGQTDLYIRNAERLGVDLSKVDFAVLSHGHYDHGGGLEKFLEINKDAPVYVSRFAFEPHYNGFEKYIGLNVKLIDNPRLIFVDDLFSITENMHLYSCNNKDRFFDLGSFGLCTFEDGEFVPDDFRHEQYLLIEENDKKVLISGCSHKGIIDITRWFTPDVLIGGFHFCKLEIDNRLKEYAEVLNRYDTVFYTCHCTGVEQYDFMKEHMKHIDYLKSGMTIEI